MILRRRRRPENDGPTLNLAAMLDMAFQLLAFFILTFKPQPVEYAVGLKLPKPEKVKADAPEVAQLKPNDAGPAAIQQVVVSVVATPEGGIATLALNGNQFAQSPADLQTKMQNQVTAADGGIDRVMVEFDPRLKMASVAAVFERCLALKLPNGERLTKVSPVLGKTK